MSDHGRIIPLTSEPYEPERHVEVYAGYALEGDESLAEEVSENLAHIRQESHGHPVAIRSRSRVTLAGVAAEHVVVRYYETKTNKWSVEDFVVRLRGGMEYLISLRTPEQSYEHDRPIFDAIVKSFAFARN